MLRKLWLQKLLILLLFFPLLIPAPLYAAFGDFGIQDEKELGQKFEVLVTSRLPLVQDPVVLSYAQDLLQRVQEVIPAQPFELEIKVLRDGSLNAFAAPSGKIFLHSGLILAMQEESELVAVLAHELAHVKQRHIAGNIERSKWISLGSLAGVLAGVLLGGGGAGSQALAVGSMAGGQAAALKYSRSDEREADQLGLEYLVRAGYNPQAMADSFRRIRRHKLLGGSSADIPEYMLTHPGLEARIGEVESMSSRMDPEVLARQSDNSRLRRVQMLLRARYQNPSRAMPHFQDQEGELSCMQLLGLAILQQRSNEILKGEQSLQKALECGRDQALWQREAGRFYFQQGRFQEAEKYLQRALNQDSRDYMTLYYLSRIRAENGQLQKAAQGLRQVVHHLPRNHEVHTVLGRVLGRQGDEFSGYLHYAYAYLYQNNQERTKYYMQRAKENISNTEEKQRFSELESEYQQVSQFW
ncbi:MAG: M48 family metalloprotease [Desulfohalobiaceae bacterium]